MVVLGAAGVAGGSWPRSKFVLSGGTCVILKKKLSIDSFLQIISCRY